jgi:hypothetical protein
MLAGLEPLPRRRLPRAIPARQAGPKVFLDEVHRDRMPVETVPVTSGYSAIIAMREGWSWSEF